MKRRFISSLLAVGMLSSAFAGMTITASAADVGTTWKFDFGPDNQTVASGYYGVTPTTEYNATSDNGFQYGLVGQNTNDYKLGNYVDGVTVVQGQVVNYAGAGSGSAADNDCLGIGTLDEGQTEGIYPIRFMMDAENDGYYEVTVKVTTLDSTKPAQGVFVYSERRHPIVTNQTIAAGQTQTVTFRAAVESILVKDRANGGSITYVDDRLNVSVMGDNAAISSIEVTKIDPSTTKTIWCYNDSTGCDYAMALPYFPLQNYGGTAQYLSKYLPENIALVNQGDGGLASGASTYFNLNKSKFSAGDYVYMQYGHNESGKTSYLKNLPTYYKAAHEKGAIMVYAGPIDRHNSSQYNASTNTWSSTLSAYSDTAKKYTEILICAGADAGDTFVTKAQTSWDDADAYYSEIINAGITSAGVTDVAFVDLNAPTISWLSAICEEVKAAQNASSYSRASSDYYYVSRKGSSVDGTHENDYGADATASFFFDGINAKASAAAGTIEAVEYAALSPLVTNMRAAYGSWDHANTDYYTNGVYTQGAAPNNMWPVVFKSSNAAAYPTAVKSITWNDDGTIASVAIVKQESKISMDDYGMLKLDIYDKNDKLKGTIKSSQVDNTWSDGTTTTYAVGDESNQLTGDTSATYIKADGDTYTATIYRASKGDGAELQYIDPLEAYSETYVPTDYEGALITNEDGNAGEDFNYYGAKYDGTDSAADKNNWKMRGSASKSANLYQDADRYYMTVTTASSGSMNMTKTFVSSPAVTSTGRIKMSVDLRKASGNMQFTLASDCTDNYPKGQTLPIFIISGGSKVLVNGQSSYNAGDVSGSSWQTVTADVDFDRGTVTVKVGDGTPVTAPVSNLQKNIGATPSSLKGICIAKSGNSNAGSVDVSNLSIDKYTAADDLGTKTLTFAKTGNGTVQVKGTAEESATVTQSQPVTLKAVPADFYSFTNWTDAEGNVLSTEANYTYPRVYEDATITANFTSTYGEGYTAEYINGFTEDFEGNKNIFDESSSNIFDTTTIDSKSIYGNVLRIPYNDSNARTASLTSAIALEERQFVELSHNTFFTYAPNGGIGKFAVLDENDKELVSYQYNTGNSQASSTYITDVKIGGVTPEDFKGFGGNSATVWQATDKYVAFNYTSATGSNAAGKVTIRINADKSVKVTFTKESSVNTYTGTLTDDVTLKSITVRGGSKNSGREYGFDNFTAALVTAPDLTVADYTLSADKQYVSKTGTVNLTVSDAKNKDGDALKDVDASSATYSCAESGVTISDAGVVTIDSGFDMGGAEFKTVTVTASIDGVEKTVSFNVADYDYFEDFSSGTGGFGSNASNSDGALAFDVQDKKTSTKSFSSPISESNVLKVTFDWKSDVSKTNGNRYSSFGLFDSNNINIFTIQAKGYKANNNNATVNYTVGSAAAVNIVSAANTSTSINNWYRIVLNIDFEKGTLSGTITDLTDSTKSVETINSTAISATNLATMKTIYGYSSAPQKLDNLGVKIIEKTLQDEVAESGNTTISGTYDGESAEIPANTTVTIGENASITNGTLTAANNGKITVKVDGSTISNASSVQFDSEGKVTPADGAVISTPNKSDNTATDKGFFVTKTVEEGADKVTFTINNKEYAGTIEGKSGSVLFGIFVTGIPANTDVTVE